MSSLEKPLPASEFARISMFPTAKARTALNPPVWLFESVLTMTGV
jgi:hypothetical protein